LYFVREDVHMNTENMETKVVTFPRLGFEKGTPTANDRVCRMHILFCASVECWCCWWIGGNVWKKAKM